MPLPQVVATEPSQTLHVKPAFMARGDRSYVLTGGLGGFGLALAAWLCQHGARHIVLSSKRCAPNTGSKQADPGIAEPARCGHIVLSSKRCASVRPISLCVISKDAVLGSMHVLGS